MACWSIKKKIFSRAFPKRNIKKMKRRGSSNVKKGKKQAKVEIPDWEKGFFANRNLMQHFTLFTPVISLMSLVRTCTWIRGTLHKSVYEIAVSRILWHLKKLASDVNRMMLLKYVFTGGSLLGALSDEIWLPMCHDIDMCYNRIDCGWSLPYFSNFEGRDEREHEQVGVHYGGGATKRIETIHDLEAIDGDSIILQLIGIDPRYTIEDYVRNYDLSFCKNLLDSKKLLVCDPHSVLKKSTFFDIDFYLELFVAEDNYMIYVENRASRLIKYKTRGYQIDIFMTTSTHEQITKKLSGEYLDIDLSDEHQELIERGARRWIQYWRPQSIKNKVDPSDKEECFHGFYKIEKD
jgi:hypothetical protein